MDLLRSIKSLFSRAPYQAASLGFMNGVMNGAKPRPYNYEAAVRALNSWVFAAASLNANSVAAVPLRLYVRRPATGRKSLWRTRPASRATKAYLQGDAACAPSSGVLQKTSQWGDDWGVVTDAHPALKILQTVNDWQNGFELFSLMTLYLELVGNAYLMPVLNPATGLPSELWALPSQWVTIKPGVAPGSPFIEGYRYGRTSADAVDFASGEVIHFKRPNPRDPYYGLGKVEAGWSAVSLNESHHVMDLSFADNMARPDYVAIVKGAANSDNLDRFEAAVQKKLRGSRNQGQFLAISGEVELKQLNFAPKDLVGRDDVVEEIAAVFGVPISMLKANDPNLASAKIGYTTWREQTILPICRLIEETLNAAYAPLWGEEFAQNAIFAFDNPVPPDDRFVLDRQVQLVNAGILTIDEARAEQGYGPVAGER